VFDARELCSAGPSGCRTYGSHAAAHGLCVDDGHGLTLTLNEIDGEVAVGEPLRIGGNRRLQLFRRGAACYFQFWRELWLWRSVVSE
jgi:hypothetical protein